MSQPKAIEDLADPILTSRAVAALLGVSVSTAQQWIESGAIASWKTPGGHRRVRRSAVMAVMGRSAQPQNIETGAASHPDDNRGEFDLPAGPTYPIAPDEGKRLNALLASGLIDTAPEQVFDRITWLATRIADTPMALVSLLTARRQWFKSRIGIDVVETPREWAFCGHAVLRDTPLIVSDARDDDRFSSNPLVLNDPFIRFYAGFPVSDREGYRLGTLCVLDRRPRVLDQEQRRGLSELAAIASEEIARRS
ncbi:GAF domain-containing protein [Noviherbaspirillum soli]|uniref:GAF domain-containing protein n=1 Tax=Noviherbaspirillum soli TaxID=1064518 RepID=UPI00188C10B8|nr:GAF domain-containing protein [Noviherbaspirillum soli]